MWRCHLLLDTVEPKYILLGSPICTESSSSCGCREWGFGLCGQRKCFSSAWPDIDSLNRIPIPSKMLITILPLEINTHRKVNFYTTTAPLAICTNRCMVTLHRSIRTISVGHRGPTRICPSAASRSYVLFFSRARSFCSEDLCREHAVQHE